MLAGPDDGLLGACPRSGPRPGASPAEITPDAWATPREWPKSTIATAAPRPRSEDSPKRTEAASYSSRQCRRGPSAAATAGLRAPAPNMPIPRNVAWRAAASSPLGREITKPMIRPSACSRPTYGKARKATCGAEVGVPSARWPLTPLGRRVRHMAQDRPAQDSGEFNGPSHRHAPMAGLHLEHDPVAGGGGEQRITPIGLRGFRFAVSDPSERQTARPDGLVPLMLLLKRCELSGPNPAHHQRALAGCVRGWRRFVAQSAGHQRGRMPQPGDAGQQSIQRLGRLWRGSLVPGVGDRRHMPDVQQGRRFVRGSGAPPT